jgi:hypothetical protein
MGNRVTKGSYFKAGMYLLENLTAGMYTEPMSIYREYIQNAVDSIDLSIPTVRKALTKVNIILEPFAQKITISDNGAGIPSNVAQQILSSIGSSNKTGSSARGFRGIGRLGGIAFSDKAIFRTKAVGEDIESIQEWDCKKLRNLISDQKMLSKTLKASFQEITHFSQHNSKRSENSYFEVTLLGVSSFRNYIMDVAKIRQYICQVAPVPFNHSEFSYSKEIEKFLMANLNHYSKYNIMLNGKPIYKPYSNKVKLTKKGFDHIDGIRFFEIKINEDSTVAYGWYGVRRNFLGSIIKGDKSSGIRVRAGNIQIGDEHLLDGCFREARFNSYVTGEIYVDSPTLIPNSRRDDFVDNKVKTEFYNSIEREIGLPISKEIRLRSRIGSKNVIPSISSRKNNAILKIKLDNSPREIRDVPMTNDALPAGKDSIQKNYLEFLQKICGKCAKLKQIQDAIKLIV